jgi:hypothetical protein
MSRRAWIAVGAGAALLEAAVLRIRGQGLGGSVVVRCRRGHVFTTIWLPAASVKSLRLGPWRAQWCPVGHHWSIVTPADAGALTWRERRAAAAHHDIRIP